MYNTTQKEKFIYSYTTQVSVNKLCVQLFNKFEDLENSWGNDLCTREAKDLQIGLEKFCGIRNRSKLYPLKIIKAYIKWCIDNNIPGAIDGTIGLEEDFLGKLKDNTISGPVELQNYLNTICDPVEKDTVDNIIRCFYWLAFGGMKQVDIMNVTSNNIDLFYMVARANNKEYVIYREAVPAIRKCIELRQFLLDNPNHATPVYVDRVDGNCLLRGIHGTPNQRSMKVRLSKMANYKDSEHDDSPMVRLSYKKVWLSGIFYRLFEAERAGIEPDFISLAIELSEGKKYKLPDAPGALQSKYKKIAKIYAADYERWKLAFSLE